MAKVKMTNETTSSIINQFLANTSDRHIEKIMLGKNYQDAPVIASRICGKGSFAHNIAANKAIENACQISVSKQTENLRELALIAEIIKNHTNLLYCDILPNFIGATHFSDLQKDHPHLFENAIALNSFADAILILIGGRTVHPITCVSGGFLSYPKKDEFLKIEKYFSEIGKIAEETVRLFSGFEYPNYIRKKNFMALHQKNNYAIYDGDVWTSNDICFSATNYKENILEEQLPQFDIKSALIRGHHLTVGPLARILINKTFSNKAAKTFSDLNLKLSFQNSFDNILGLAIENYILIDKSLEMISLLEANGIQKETPIPAKKFGTGASACESADGIIFHHYELDNEGSILKAEIVSPSNINFKYFEREVSNILAEKSLDQEEKNKLIKLLALSLGFCAPCAKH